MVWERCIILDLREMGDHWMFNSILASVHRIPELLLRVDDPKQISSNDFWGGTLAVHEAIELACRTAEKPFSHATPLSTLM